MLRGSRKRKGAANIVARNIHTGLFVVNSGGYKKKDCVQHYLWK